MNNEQKKRILEIISTTIVIECIKKEFTNSCYPLALMFYEQCQKYGIQAKIVEGYGITGTRHESFAYRHYWVECDGKEYDLRRDIYAHLEPDMLPTMNCLTFPPSFNLLTTPDDVLMEWTHKMIGWSDDVGCYFNLPEAPLSLLALRSNISEKIQKTVTDLKIF